jgi:tetratricopeptide (TPR) repeat protein
MKKLLLASVAALFLATGTAHAADFCAMVIKPPAEVTRDKEFNPNGWLALRKEPSPHSEKIALLREGDFLAVGDSCATPWEERGLNRACEDDREWLRVFKVYRFDKTSAFFGNGLSANIKCKIATNGWVRPNGWVRRKYMQEYACQINDQAGESDVPECGDGGLTDASAQSRCRVMDPTGTPLNVRTTPNGYIVGTLNNGDQVTVLDRTSDRRGKAWVYVGNYENNKPIGWVFREFIACGVEQVPAIRPRSRDDAAQQNSRICFDPGSSHDERELGCSAVIESGHESGRTLSMAFCNRGNVLIERQEYDRAIADLNQAIVIDPGYACSYNNRGRAFGFKGDYDRALTDYNQAIRLDPKFALAYNNRADVWLHKGELDQAIEDLSTAIRLDPKFVLGYTNRCRAWSSQRNFARAIADCDQAIALAPSSRMTYLLRGSIFRDMKKYDNAVADYSQVIRLAPNDAEGWRNRGLIWLLKHDDDRGIADYDQAIRLDPNDAVSYNNRGQAHLSKGHREQAIADFRKALELQPGHLNAVQGLKRLGLTP